MESIKSNIFKSPLKLSPKSIHSKKRKLFFKDGLLLAPMVRLNTLPFRLVCLDHGADIVYTEEIISFKLQKCKRIENQDLNTIDYILHDENKKSDVVLRIDKREKSKLILQIGANDPNVALKAALLVQSDVIGVDLNMGCPKHFSTHGDMGSNLLYKPDLACSILKKLRSELNQDKFVSCKIRLLEEDEKTIEFIKLIQDTGIDYFTVHLRTKHQNAKNKANWSKLDIIKKHSNIPFFCNGDIFNYDDYCKVKPCKSII